MYQAEAIVSDPKDLVEEKTHIKQALCWNGYPAWLLEGEDSPTLDQSAEEEVKENSLEPAPLQLGPSDPAETTVIKLPEQSFHTVSFHNSPHLFRHPFGSSPRPGRAEHSCRDHCSRTSGPGQSEELPSGHSVHQRGVRTGAESYEMIQCEGVLQAHQYT